MSIFQAARRTHGTAARVAALLSAARAALRDCVAGFGTRRRARRSVWLLQALSDRELKDIGLTRSDVWRIARDRARPGG